MKKFLIVKTSALGDIVHAFPVVSYLKEKFPDCTIDWVVEEMAAELLHAHPLIDQVLPVATKRWRKNICKRATWKEICSFRSKLKRVRYDAVFDLQGNTKSAWITLQALSSTKVGFGRKSVPEWPNLLVTNLRSNPPPGQNVRQDYMSLVQNYFQDKNQWKPSSVKLKVAHEPENYLKPHLKNILVCPGSAWPNKQLSTDALIDFLTRLRNSHPCNYLFAWGAPTEHQLAQQLHNHFLENSLILPKLSLPELQNLMTQVSLVVAMDSLPLHLAGTTATPTFSVFGPSSAHKYAPIGPQHCTVQGSCPYGKTFDKRCPILRTCPTGSCIKQLTGHQLFQNISAK